MVSRHGVAATDASSVLSFTPAHDATSAPTPPTGCGAASQRSAKSGRGVEGAWCTRPVLPTRSALTASFGPAEMHQSGPIETTAKTPAGQVTARPAFGLARLAVAAGFEPAEGCPSRAFEFYGWWFRPVRLGLVPPEPRLGCHCGRPRTYTHETKSETKRSGMQPAVLISREQPSSRLRRACPPVSCALRVASVSSIKCLPHVAGRRMCRGVHDRPVRRLLAWLLTLLAWEAGGATVSWCPQPPGRVPARVAAQREAEIYGSAAARKAAFDEAEPSSSTCVSTRRVRAAPLPRREPQRLRRGSSRS
jgi:hypothetical protein